MPSHDSKAPEGVPTEPERGRTGQDAREQQQLLDTLLANLPGLVYRCRNDPQWTVMFISGGCLGLTGYKPVDFINNHKLDYASLIHPDDRERVWNEVQAAVTVRQPFELQYRIHAADGKEKNVWERGRGIFSDAGELLALEGYVTDITERKRAETLLKGMAESLAGLTGQEFFQQLVLYLVKALEVDYAFVGEVSPHDARIIQTLAFCDHGKLADNIEYQLVPETACGSVECKTVCDFPEGVRKLYPEDEILSEFNVEAFIAHPLYDVAGNVLGLLTVMHSRPIADRKQIRSILQICAVRAAMELERQRAELALRENEERFRNLTELSSDWYWEQDSGFRFTLVTHSAGNMKRFPTGETLGKTRWELPYLDVPPEVWAEHKRQLAAHAPFHDLVLKRRDAQGNIRYSNLSGVPILDAQGVFKGYRGTGHDVTEHVRAESERQRLTSAIEQTADAVLITDPDGTIEYANPAYEATTGYSREEVIGRKPNIVKSGQHDERFYRELWRTILDGRPFRAVFINRRKNGELYYEEKTITPIRSPQGVITHFVSTGKDITERKRAEERLSFLAYYDVLTGLPNRALLLDHLKQATIEADRIGRLVAVMFLDLDRFKVINDTLGHHVGDALLKGVAERLQACVRPGDTISRLGGDEFTVILADVANADDVARVARKILDSFVQPFRVEDQDLFTTASVGITLYPFDVHDPEGLLKNADAAMYHAKEQGRNSFKFFTAELNVRAERRLKLETALRRALEREELSLHYQPQVDMKDGRLVGMEALLRWQSPELGNVSPAEFIPIAEETGLILPIGDWVLREACRQIKAWHATKFSFSKMQVAVNISGKQLRQKDFPDRVQKVLLETNLEPRYLDLELTESLLMVDAEETGDIMHVLHDMGISFSVDDFGTGYSSLSYLKRFPIDILKIDQSFVRDIASDPNDVAIVKTIIAMAHTLSMRVIAEGVETYEQLVFLRDQDCDGSQGYYCSKPLAANDFTELLADWERISLGRCRAKTARQQIRKKSRPATRRRLKK
ncbi:MAG: EAL domain-containing protein [Gammaproteobacteria bacterium]|nr:EAL domain-containing protein [Gammaproteobacteria bacterium]